MRRAARSALATALLAATFSVAPAVAGLCEGTAHAQGVNRAGLVVQFAERPAQRFCVEFDQESISGLDLLRKTGLDVSIQDYGGGNVAVCAIEDEGCSYPGQQCFCRCANLADCTLWGFYRIDAGGSAWTFSQEGAGVVRVRDGEVHGWRWAAHTTAGGSPPDAATLAAVCEQGRAIRARPAPAQRDDGGGAGGILAVAAVLAGLAALGFWAFARGRPRDAE